MLEARPCKPRVYNVKVLATKGLGGNQKNGGVHVVLEMNHLKRLTGSLWSCSQGQQSPGALLLFGKRYAKGLPLASEAVRLERLRCSVGKQRRTWMAR